MRYNDYVVRYETVDKHGRIRVEEKSFETELAREKFLNKIEDSGKLLKVLAYSDPQ